MKRFHLGVYLPVLVVMGVFMLVSQAPDRVKIPAGSVGPYNNPASDQHPDSLSHYYYHPKRPVDIARERFEYLKKHGSFKHLGVESPSPNLTKTNVTEWENIGPYGLSACPATGGRNDENYSGRIISLAQDYGNPDIMYLGAASGGLWKSTDRGISWTNIFDDLPHPSVGAIATNVKKPGEVWIGTGDKGNGASGTGAPTLGLVYYSDNYGASWTPIDYSPVLNGYVSKILVRPGANSSLPDVVFITTDVGVFRSEDRTNWSKVLSGVYTDIVYVGSVFSPDFKVIAARIDLDFIYVSGDKGLPGTWVSKVLPGSGPSYGRVSLTSSTIGLHTKVYANVAADSDSLWGIWRSDNGGDTWVKVTKPYTGGQMSYNNTILVEDELSGNTVYTGTNSRELFRSTDGGNSWSTSFTGTFGKIHEDQQCLLDDASRSGQIFVGNDGGLYKSTDKGQNFTFVGNSFLSITQIYHVTVSPEAGGLFDGSRYYIGTQDVGVQRGPNEFLEWLALTCCDGGDIAFKGGIHYSTIVGLSATSPNRIQRPPDPNPCQPWQGFTAGLPAGTPWNSQLIYNGTHFYLSFIGNVYRATNGALPWSQLQTFGTITRIGVTPEHIVVVGVGNPIPVRVSNAANTIFTSPSNPASFWDSKLVTDVDFGKLLGDKRDIYVSLSSTSGTRVVRSTNNGASFADITGDLPNLVNVRSILVDPTSDNILYAGSDLGVFVSFNRGVNWVNYSNKLPGVCYVNDLEFDPYSLKIVAGTYGRGVFISDQASPTLVEDQQRIPAEFHLSANYPNPFNPTTRIQYSLPQRSSVLLKVYDMLGREISTLVNEEKDAGVHTVDFSPADLASGVFIYRMEAGRYVSARKMLLLK